MRALTFLVLLVASVALAGDSAITRGGFLKARQYQTYSALTYYVDPTGSDSNACTASGAAACLTLGGALSKLPINLRYATTVNLAAGTYTEVPRAYGFNIEGPNDGQAATAALTIAGTMANFTPATGTATGTATGYSGASGLTKAALSDSGQTWTVNNLSGSFLQITSGTGSGQYRPIVSNTATAISVATAFSPAPTAGSGYAIVTPATIFTGGTAMFRGFMGGGTFTVQDIQFSPASGTALNMANIRPTTTLRRVRIVGAASGVLGTGNISSLTVDSSYISGGTGSGLTLGGSSFTPIAATITNNYVHCSTGTCAGTGIFLSTGSTVNNLSGTIDGTWTTAAVSSTGSAGTIQATELRVDCGASSMTGIRQRDPVDSDSPAPAGGWGFNNGPYITGCGTALLLAAPGISVADGPFLGTSTTGIDLRNGARLKLRSATFSTVTDELVLDGTSYTYAFWSALSPVQIVSPLGSVLSFYSP